MCTPAARKAGPGLAQRMVIVTTRIGSCGITSNVGSETHGTVISDKVALQLRGADNGSGDKELWNDIFKETSAIHLLQDQACATSCRTA